MGEYQPRQIGLGMELDPPPREDIDQVIAELSKPCKSCGLSLLYPKNPGLVTRGNHLGEYALVSEMPGPIEWRQKPPKAMMGPAGRELNLWCERKLGIDNNTNALIINVIQCKPPDTPYKDKGRIATDKEGNPLLKQRGPRPDELRKCFPRCVRVLKAMPNLRCIISLGTVATGMLIGDDPTERVHTGGWIITRTFPGVLMYVLPHPAAILHGPTQSKIVKTTQLLDRFRMEYPKMLKHMKERICPSQ